MIKKTKVIKLPETLVILTDDGPKTVATADYVKAKTKDLRAFGYAGLEEAAVREQLHCILGGGKPSVIGMFMKDEIQK